MNNHKCPEELVAAIERSRVLESLTPAQAAAFDDVIAEKNRQIERAYDGLNYQDRQITELRARIAELEAERAELVKDRERSPSHSFAGILVWKGDHSYSYAITEHAINNGTCDPFAVALHEAMKAIDAAGEGE